MVTFYIFIYLLIGLAVWYILEGISIIYFNNKFEPIWMLMIIVGYPLLLFTLFTINIILFIKNKFNI